MQISSRVTAQVIQSHYITLVFILLAWHYFMLVSKANLKS